VSISYSGQIEQPLLSQVSENAILRASTPLREGEADYPGRVVCVLCV
jgi:hypothetical protein